MTFYNDEMIDLAVLQSRFCADVSYKDFDELCRPSGESQEWHLFSITTWCACLQRTVTALKAAVISKCEDLYQELFAEFLRECGLKGQRMPTVATAMTARTTARVAPRKLVSLTVDFSKAQAHGAATASAHRAGLASTLDATRAFLRGYNVHFRRSVEKLPLYKTGTDKDLWHRPHTAPTAIITEVAKAQLFADLNAHADKTVRDWVTRAAEPITMHMIFPLVHSRMSRELLASTPASTRYQESTYHANVLRAPPGSLLSVTNKHAAVDRVSMRRFFEHGSGSSSMSRPLTEQQRFLGADQRARGRKRSQAGDQGDEGGRVGGHEEDTPAAVVGLANPREERTEGRRRAGWGHAVAEGLCH